MKKKIRLTENDIHKIIKKYVRKALTEGSTNQDVYNKWETIKEILGCDAMVDSIWNYLSSDMLEKLVKWFNQDYELFDDEDDEDDLLSEGYMDYSAKDGTLSNLCMKLITNDCKALDSFKGNLNAMKDYIAKEVTKLKGSSKLEKYRLLNGDANRNYGGVLGAQSERQLIAILGQMAAGGMYGVKKYKL